MLFLLVLFSFYTLYIWSHNSNKSISMNLWTFANPQLFVTKVAIFENWIYIFLSGDCGVIYLYKKLYISEVIRTELDAHISCINITVGFFWFFFIWTFHLLWYIMSIRYMGFFQTVFTWPCPYFMDQFTRLKLRGN